MNLDQQKLVAAKEYSDKADDNSRLLVLQGQSVDDFKGQPHGQWVLKTQHQLEPAVGSLPFNRNDALKALSETGYFPYQMKP